MRFLEYKKSLPYIITGFTIGIIFTVIIAAWGSISIVYRGICVGLFIVLLTASTAPMWSKQKTNSSNNSPNNNP